MKLKTSDLKSFKANSASIKANNIMPILSYLKFDKNKVTKNALNSFIIQDMPGATPLLVDEKTLWALVDKTSSDTIEIKEKDGRIIISDGKYNPACSSEKFDTYPVTKDPEDKSVDISEFISDIKIASHFVEDNLIETAKVFIHAGNDRISGTDASIMFYKKVDLKKEMVLRKETIQSILKFNSVKFSESESYHFFTTDKCVFGFSKPEMKFFDMSVVIPSDYKENPFFVVDKSDIVEFNEICMSACPAKMWIAELSFLKDKIKLSFNDTDYEQTNEVKIDAEVHKEQDNFRYNCVLMNKLLKSLPDSQLTFYRNKNNYIIEGLGGYVAIIVGLIPQV